MNKYRKILTILLLTALFFNNFTISATANELLDNSEIVGSKIASIEAVSRTGSYSAIIMQGNTLLA